MRHNPSKQAQTLAAWLLTAPPDAERLEVRDKPIIGGGESERLQNLQWRTHAGSDLHDLAKRIIEQSDQYAESMGRETTFTAKFLDQHGDEMCTHLWRCVGGEEAALSFSGDAAGIIQQLQQQNHVLLKMHLAGVSASQTMLKEALDYASGRIRQLEGEASKLRGVDNSRLELDAATLVEEHETHRAELFVNGVMQVVKALASNNPKEAVEAVETLRQAAQPGPTTEGGADGQAG